MNEADRSYTYRASCGHVTGRSHLKDSTSCQDYAATRIQQDFACIALADGAGSKRHSAYGARAVVKAVIRALAERFEEMWTASNTSPTEVSSELIDCCRLSLEHQANKLGCEVSELASTLMFVAHSKGRFLAGHVGDGCIIYRQDDGDVAVLSHPDNGEYSNTTFFVTDSKVHSHFRLYRGMSSRGSGFLVMSDGTAESLYRRVDKSPATQAIHKILSWCGTASPKEMRAALKQNLEHSFGIKTPDDCSIAVLALRASG